MHEREGGGGAHAPALSHGYLNLALQASKYATFYWDFVGMGNTTCLLDGAPYVTDERTGGCGGAGASMPPKQ